MQINVTKIYHKVILKRADSKAKQLLLDISKQHNKPLDVIEVELTVYLGMYILKYLQNAITEQRLNNRHMKSRYTPLSPDYQKTKPAKTRSMHWINTGELLKALVVRYNTDRTAIVITTKNKYRKDGKTKHEDVIKWNELGTKKMPARPLFKPAIDNITRNLVKIIGMYYKSNY